ncbi:MAG: hypothetical protein M3135_02720 [Actinomycetota bacterium]|nr:hypothetical protein [Actinomycetota bacterium]
MVGCAYLRVFQPIEAVPADERLRSSEERFAAPRRYRHVGPAGNRIGLLEASGDRTEVRTEGERTFVCPSRTRIRVLAAMLSLRESAAPEVAEALVPEVEARRAARELARIRRRQPGAVPTLLESAWHVPVTWFVLFEDAERRMNERSDGGYELRYWTTLRRARQRAEHAVGVLQRTDLGPVADMVRDLEEWLSFFDPGSRVELDYGDAAASLGWNELDEDHSAREVQDALAALEGDDPERAGELYQAVAGRWAEARIRESLN